MNFKEGEYIRIKTKDQLVEVGLIDHGNYLEDRFMDDQIVKNMLPFLGQIIKVYRIMNSRENKKVIIEELENYHWYLNWIEKLNEKEQKICEVLYGKNNSINPSISVNSNSKASENSCD